MVNLRPKISCNSLPPGGDERYNVTLQYYLDSDISPNEVHRIGLLKVDKLRRNIKQVKMLKVKTFWIYKQCQTMVYRDHLPNIWKNILKKTFKIFSYNAYNNDLIIIADYGPSWLLWKSTGICATFIQRWNFLL